ncbi:MAG: hypothetical protein KA191_09035 [Verrucomicrobia bacterium]|mgnify:CR=1 FL=1|jgi:hypothetical protein|nr:hypothetical protein [Verrucomicrobiota bacterium]OQC67028.1 MAG: hypothetical protein BWX48_01100 [Verrucomicrobia bacterium ADurb.Bin006]MDI9382298.1 hypothetical protein [Verrucomicrobiota bacterium]NMD20135.1 hypothetical protein [Verrucomicrobiota bacterium]HOA60555.1 hypothetical protein [Verrucomicrobiota bacterium]
MRVSQRGGTKLVDIYYDLTTAGTNATQVAVAVSTYGGLSYTLPTTNFAGAVSSD